MKALRVEVALFPGVNRLRYEADHLHLMPKLIVWGCTLIQSPVCHLKVVLNQRHAQLCLSRFEVLAVVIAEIKVSLGFSPCRHLRRLDFSFLPSSPYARRLSWGRLRTCGIKIQDISFLTEISWNGAQHDSVNEPRKSSGTGFGTIIRSFCSEERMRNGPCIVKSRTEAFHRDEAIIFLCTFHYCGAVQIKSRGFS